MDSTARTAVQRAKFAKKVHKPPLRVNVINFELNGYNHQYGSLGVPQTPKSCDALIEVLKFIYVCVKISFMFAPILP